MVSAVARAARPRAVLWDRNCRHLVVLEVGVAEVPQGRLLGAECARGRRRCACVAGGGGRAGLVRGHGLSPPFRRPRAVAVRPHSLWWARQARGMCGGEGTAMCPVAYAPANVANRSTRWHLSATIREDGLGRTDRQRPRRTSVGDRRRKQSSDPVAEGHCQVDENHVDRPPRYWALARREPTMLGIKNSRQPQLDNTLPSAARAHSPPAISPNR